MKIRLSIILFFIFTIPVSADVAPSLLFSDNCVLQRGEGVPVWGTAQPGEEVTVSIGTQTKKTKAGEDGTWKVELDELKPGQPLTMTIKGNNTVTVKNILVGEVWVASGQSNMGVRVKQSLNSGKEIKEAQYPEIRHFNVPVKGSPDLEKKLPGGVWKPVSPETVSDFSAVAYFFSRDIHKALDVPVGIIHSSKGGSGISLWMSEKSMLSDAFSAKWHKAMTGWKKNSPPDQKPCHLYNAMIHPLMPYRIKGVIWYQGEANTSGGGAYWYEKLFPQMITQWRSDWGQGDFPFLFVQLANFKKKQAGPDDSNWARLRETQLWTLDKVKNTGMAVTIDIGDAKNIHPKNKQDVGKRLALWARARVYGESTVYSGPLYKEMKIEGGKAVISFNHTGSGLTGKDGAKLEGFAIAGEDKKFVWAEAVIEGDTVVVSSSEIPVPKAVRYAWAVNPIGNLYNKEGLPASPFRTDTWPASKKLKW